MLDQLRTYEMTIRPLGRSPADEYFHNGNTWIEGRDGNRYTVDISNHTSTRALFIVSVDGLDVIDGKPAGLDSTGYVIDANSSISIPGWKLNNQEAAEFYFSRGRDSYVNTIGGNTANTGVIGAMVFSEYVYKPQYFTYNNLLSTGTVDPLSNPFNGMPYTISGKSGLTYAQPSSAGTLRSVSCNNSITASINQPQQEIGTGFGDATEWKTNTAQFTRADPNNPDAIIAIYYNTARNLEKMGIRLRKKNNPGYTADPFPGYTSSQNGGCRTPPGWKGRS